MKVSKERKAVLAAVAEATAAAVRAESHGKMLAVAPVAK